MRQPGWAHFAGKGLQSEAKATLTEVPKFQRMAVERLRTCDDVNELAQELGVTRRCLYKWRVKLETIEPGEDASRPSTHTSSKTTPTLAEHDRRRVNQVWKSCSQVEQRADRNSKPV
jgi:transposase-like protein